MVKHLQFKSWLLMMLLLIGSGSAWAGESTLTFTKACGGSGTANDGVKWTVASDGTESNFDNTKGIHYGTSKAAVGYIKLTTSGISGTITKVVVNASGASGTTGELNVTVGGAAFGGDPKSLSSTATEYTFTGSASGEIVVTVSQSSAKKALYVKSVEVTYEAASSSPLSSIALSGDYPTTFREGDAFSHAGMTVTATYEDETTKDVTSKAVFTGYDMETPGTQTVTVTYTEGDVVKNATYQITVNAIPTHNVTFNVNGATTSDSYKEGVAIEFPESPEAISEKAFVGWTTDPINGTIDEAPEFVTSATMGTADVTYYAVFAEGTAGDLKVVTDELKLAFTGVTGTSYTSWSDKAGKSGAVYAGQSAGGNDAIQLRSKNNNSGVITTTSGGKATKVAVVWSNTADGRTINIYGKNTAYTDATDLYNSNNQGDLLGTIVCGTSTELTIDGDYEYIGVRSADGALYLGTLSITWESGTAASYSGYCTTVAADATTSYGVVVVDVDHGLIASDKETAKAGEKVVISYELDEGYAFGEWVVEDGDGNPVSVSYENEEYSFTMPANDVQISATYKKIHTVHYSVAGVEEEVDRNDGDALNLGVPEAVNGMAFAGWSTTNNLNAPEFVANDAAVTDDMILYAMFTAKSGSTFNKVTTTEDLTSGDYLIVYEAEKMAFDGSLETLDAVSNAIRVDISDNKIAATAETNAAVFTIDTENGTLRSASGYYIGQESYTNGLKSSTEETYTNTFSIDAEGNAVITASGKCTLRYNSASNQNRFRYYKSGQQAIQLYKKVAGESVYTLAVPVEASISDAKYATFHSDKNVYFSTSDVEVYTAHYNGNYVELTEVADGLVPANTAVVLHKDVDDKTTVEAYEVGDVEALTNNGLKISDGATAVGNGIYVLSNKSHGVGFYHWASDQSLSVGKVYIEIPAAGEAREFIGMVAGGSTTGISEVTSHAAQQSGVIYDLQGRKVETLKRGLYIINGKKAIIK